MSLDPQNLERLRQLRRELPQKIPAPKKPKEPSSMLIKSQTKFGQNNKPEFFFKELMRISPDGNVPKHLLDELKELEMNSLPEDQGQKISKANRTEISKHLPNKRDQTENEEQKLYSHFKNLLLDEEI